MFRSVHLGQSAIRQQFLWGTRVPSSSRTRIGYPQGQYNDGYRRVRVNLWLFSFFFIDRAGPLFLIRSGGPGVFGLRVF